MTNHQIEIWAVDKVEEVFTRSKFLVPAIPRGDKGPAWDGVVYLLSDDNKLTRRIPVQVKGKTRKALPNKPSYPIKVTNLKNYLRDGGILYCVVYIVEEKKYLYYAKLAPVDLKRYIKMANGQDTIAVKLMPFDKSVIQMEQEMISFCNDCKKQTSFVDAPILSLEEVVKQGRKINFQLNGTSSASGEMIFSKEPVYLYAEIEEGDTVLYYPIGDQAYNISAGPHIKEPVLSNGKKFYDEFVIFEFEGRRSYIVENILNVNFSKVDGKLIPDKTNVESKATMLSAKIKEMSFIYEMFSSGCVSLGKTVLCLKDIPETQVKEAEDELLYWKRARVLFDKLCIKEDINIGIFTKTDKDNLTMLMNAILDNKPIVHESPIDIVAHTDISKYRIFIMAEKNEDGTYKVSNFFDSEDKMCFAYEDKEGNKLVTSMFTIALMMNDFNRFSNVDYSKMVPSYVNAAKYNPYIVERANLDLLLAINIYDKKKPEDTVLYDSLVTLNNWILLNDKEKNSIHIINKYQIIKRKRKLEKSEKQELLSILDSHDLGADMLTAIHLLLDNVTQAELCYDKMQSDEQKFFDTLPISFFRN